MTVVIRSAVLVLALALASVAAHAEPPPVDAKAQGDAAMVELRFADALTHYDAAYRATGSATLLYNMGRAHEGLGHFPEALSALEAFRDKAPPDVLARVGRLDDLIREVRVRVSTLVLAVNVEGATVTLGDRVLGTTPLAPTRVNAGTVSLAVQAEGFLAVARSVTLPGGGSLALEIALFHRDTTGVLAVRSPVEGAEILVDGKRIGTAPGESFVSAGAHRVLVRREGFEDAEQSVIVAAGERKTLDVSLVRRQAITARWWFWAGVGAVAITSAIVVTALIRERKPDEGTSSPGTVSAPLVRFLRWTRSRSASSSPTSTGSSAPSETGAWAWCSRRRT